MILLDTSGLLCLQYEQEPRHQQAVTAYRTATAWITHSFIIDEYIVYGFGDSTTLFTSQGY